VGSVADSKLFTEVSEACRKLEVIEDVHAPAAYRKQLAAVLSRRALQKAHENHRR
jgi:CO/xanthine dehydrogenase FAD-binding subunit